MKSSSLYGHFAELLCAIRGSKAPADAIVRRFFRERHYLGGRERRWLSSHLYGVLRHLRLIEHLVREECCLHPAFKDHTPAIAVVAAYGIIKAGEDVAGVCDAVRDRWNGDIPDAAPELILGALAERGAAILGLPATASTLGLKYSFADDVVDEWIGRLGLHETEQLLGSLNEEAPLSVRVNTLQCTVHECASRLREHGLDVQPGTISPFSLTLPRRVVLDTIPAFREGWFEMQDEGSQLLALLLQPEPGMTVVDACAGGGGKTLHLAALLENRGTLVALDPDRRRLHNLRERALRAGATIGQIIEARHDDPAPRRLHGVADAVLVDAPCSGLGTVRRNPWLKLQEVKERSRQLAAVQYSILAAAASMVKTGGRLVYSTCTLVKAENEDVIQRFLEGHPDFTLASAAEILHAWGVEIRERAPMLTLWPHHAGTDGFFAAVLIRQ